MHKKRQSTPAADSDKKRKALVRKLGAEFAILQDELEPIGEAIRDLYLGLPEGARPPEMVRLEEQEKPILNRIHEITKEFNELDRQRKSGKSLSVRKLLANRRNPSVKLRDLTIQRHRHHSDENICKVLDLELQHGGATPTGLPENWTERFGVTTYRKAYEHPKCKGLVQKLISVAKSRL